MDLEKSECSDADDTTESAKAPNVDNDEDERSQIRSELSTMSFEDLMKLKDELGSKVYDEAIFGKGSKNEPKKQKVEFKRLNKNRPREESSKRLVPFLGAELRKESKIETKVRDPRFDESCGEYNSKIFKDNYHFVNDIREKEIIQLKSKLRKTSNDSEKKELGYLVQRLENQIQAEKSRKIKESIKNQEVDEIRKAKKEGRQPHFTTKKELRTKELVKQYEDLKDSGRLEKHLEKRRKKNTAKDRKKFSFD